MMVYEFDSPLTVLNNEYERMKSNLLWFEIKKENSDEINLYNCLAKIIANSTIPIDKLSVEDAFSRYLLYCKPQCLPGYFTIIVDFVILFYDYFLSEINKDKERELSSNNKNENSNGESKDQLKKGKTNKILNAKTLPELSNTFVINYLSLQFEYLEESEEIDLIYHFCYYLHENGYTTTLISKINNNK